MGNYTHGISPSAHTPPPPPPPVRTPRRLLPYPRRALQLERLKRLIATGIVDELPVFGVLPADGDAPPAFLIGVIDEVARGDNARYRLRELRAHARPSLAKRHEAQLRTVQLQLMLYKTLWDGLTAPGARAAFPAHAFCECYGASLGDAFSPSFRRALRCSLGAAAHMPQHLPTPRCCGELLDALFAAFAALPGASSTLAVRYAADERGLSPAAARTFTERFEHDMSWAQSCMLYGLQYWRGQRVAGGVDHDEAYKCQQCEYHAECTVTPLRLPQAGCSLVSAAAAASTHSTPAAAGAVPRYECDAASSDTQAAVAMAGDDVKPVSSAQLHGTLRANQAPRAVMAGDVPPRKRPKLKLRRKP